jgi:cysteine desulfurase/selenocysteine lyase
MAQRVTYLNSASISLMPEAVIESMNKFQREIAAGGTIGFDEEAETRALEGARDRAASLLGASRDEIAILPSATDGICSIAWSLDIQEGSNVVSTDADFPSVVYPWMRIGMEERTMRRKRKKRIEVRLARNKDGIVDEDEIENLVDDKTAVISISHVEYGTGQRFDLRWLSSLAHSHGSLLVIDATQSAGLVPINVHKEGVDALVAGGYKGLLGPFGVAILYLKQELVENLKPHFVGWRSTPVPYDLDGTNLRFASGAKKFEYSTMSYASSIALAESIRYIENLGYSRVTEHVSFLTTKIIEDVVNDEKLNGTQILTPLDAKSRSSIASLRFTKFPPRRDGNQSTIVGELIQRKIIVSQRFNGIRFSFHVYNTEEDIEKAVDTLDQIVGGC